MLSKAFAILRRAFASAEKSRDDRKQQRMVRMLQGRPDPRSRPLSKSTSRW